MEYLIMKNRKFLFLLILFLSLGLFACETSKPVVDETPDYNRLTVISVNDTHGAIEASDSNYGMAGLSWYINEERKDKDNAVLVLSAGDMFQGTAISGYNHGLNMINLMNEIGFSAMTIGNHEFDWGLDETLRFVDGDKSNGEANFPMLGCNIIEKATGETPELVEDYEIIDYEKFKVGVIGYMGVGLETDIARSNVEAYEFVDPVPIVAELAAELRTEKGCDIVIAMGHDASNVTNTMLANLKDEQAIDMIINGHTHTTYVRYLTNGNGKTISVSQAGTANAALTKTVFNYNNDALTFSTSTTVKLSSYDIEEDPVIKAIVKQMQDELGPTMERVIGLAGRSVNRSSVSYWTADEILKNAEADLAGINGGGIRSSAFPIRDGEAITVKKCYEIMPFDNVIVTCQMTGQKLANVLIITDIVFSTNVKRINNVFYINDEPLDPERFYTFACVDYLFTRDEEIYNECLAQEYSTILIRDVIINGIENLNNEKWLNE